MNKSKTSVPNFLINQTAKTSLNEIIRTKNPKLIKRSIYAKPYNTIDGARSKTVDELDDYYFYKCAYCERVCKADVEHYRPKGRVREDANHPGYYWLCYEWSNLIPSCINCNREGAKHDQFPILGNRITHPVINGQYNALNGTQEAYNQPLISERPYLIHPEIDNPENFFDFEIDGVIGIRMIGIDIDGRGNKTIEICLLNRQELRIDRESQVILDFKTSTNSVITQLKNNEISKNQFRERIIELISSLGTKSTIENFSFTLLRKYIVKSLPNFQKIVLPYFDNPTQNILTEVFKKVY